MQSIRQQPTLQAVFPLFSLGIEKESHRITPEGNLATTVHPSVFGNRDFHPYIQTDFAESQIEMITPPTSSTEEAMQWLTALHEVVLRSLPNEERLWPLSMPSHFPKTGEIQVARLHDEKEVAYREHLMKVYGDQKQLMSGIHLNIGFSDEFFAAFYAVNGAVDSVAQRKLKNEWYFKQAKNFLKYEWVLTYLFGVTPFIPKSFDAPIRGRNVRSVRNSRYGYTNLPSIRVDYTNLATYRQSVLDLVHRKQLALEKELYETVRLRGIHSLKDLENHAIQYLEFRSFDLNPFAPYGMTKEDLEFIVLFTKTLSWLDEVATDEEITAAKAYKYVVALQQPEEPLEKNAIALQFLDEMSQMVEACSFSNKDALQELIAQKRRIIEDPTQTVAAKFVQQVSSEFRFGMKKAKENLALAWKEPFSLKGFQELELSTQILMFDALQKGIAVEILDSSDQFLRLTFDHHVQYVKNANMTAFDSVSSYMAMANKTVTKKILQDAGIHVPSGVEVGSVEEAMTYYPQFHEKSMVVKPKSTNYGLGISILKAASSMEDFKEALAIAFQEDSRVLIEEFIEGTEYRFFVIDGQTKAVLLRKPANVIGDGVSTIRQLVDVKNQDERRGYGHQYPLTKIATGPIETLALKQQGYTWDSIPEKDVTVFLRENSNISTGGDSIDMTDEMDVSYHAIAALAAQALGASVTGVDLMIPDYKTPAKPSDVEKYAIIEANFNPAMMMHIYPAVGEGRRLTMSILHKLFPELKMIQRMSQY